MRGYVVGKVVDILARTNDGIVRAVGSCGRVTFTPLNRGLRDACTLIPAGPVDAQFVHGQLRDRQGNLGVWLHEGPYRVEFRFDTGSIPPFEIDITGQYTATNPLDLGCAAPYVPPYGVVVRTIPIPFGGEEGQVLGMGDFGSLQWFDMDEDGGLPPGGANGQLLSIVNGQPAWITAPPGNLPVGGTNGNMLAIVNGFPAWVPGVSAADVAQALQAATAADGKATSANNTANTALTKSNEATTVAGQAQIAASTAQTTAENAATAAAQASQAVSQVSGIASGAAATASQALQTAQTADGKATSANTAATTAQTAAATAQATAAEALQTVEDINWNTLDGKPAVVAAGATPVAARTAIGAASLDDATTTVAGLVTLADSADVSSGTPGKVMTVPQVKGLLDGLGNVVAAYYDSAAGWPAARPSDEVTATVLCINLTAERVDKPSWYIEGVDLFAEWGYVDDATVESFWATVAASTTVLPGDPEALTAITVTTDTGDLIPAIAFEQFHRGQRVWCLVVGAQTYALGAVTPPTPGTLLSKLQIRDTFASQFGDTDLSLRAVEGGFVHVAGRIKSATELPVGDTQLIGFVAEPFMAANIYGGGTAEVYGRVDIPASVHKAGSIIPNGAFVQISQHGGVSFYTSAAGTDVQVNGLYVSKWADLVIPSRDLKVFQGTTFAKWLVDHTDKDGQPLEEGRQFSIRAARGKNPKLANICFHSGMGGEFAADSFNREVARLTGSHFYNLDITTGNYRKIVNGFSVQIMHVDSNLFDEPRAVELVSGARRTIAWHGCADFTATFRDDEGSGIDWGQYSTAEQRSSLDIPGNWLYPAAMAVVGGADAEFRAAIIDALNTAGFVAVDAVTTRKWSPASMSWVNPFAALTGAGPRNICNQGPLGGVQIELTNTMRGIAAGNGVAEAYVNRLSPQPQFYDFTAVVAAVMTEWGDR